MRDTEDGNHKQHRQTDDPLVDLPLQRRKGQYEEQETQQGLIVRQVCAIGIACPPRTEGDMLHKRTKDKASDKQGAHGDPQPLLIGSVRHDQQEGINCKQHRCKHKQDMWHQDMRGYIIPKPDQQGLLGGIFLPLTEI